MAPETIGIVGYGNFGSFLAHSLLSEKTQVLVTDTDLSKLPTSPNGISAASMQDVAHAEVVIIAVPFASFEGAVTDLKSHLPDETVVMDVVSIKARATSLLEQILDDHPNLVASHPLFGPPSMTRINPGDRLVVTRQIGDESQKLRDYLELDLGLQVLDRDPEQHDQAMAYMQALPFFIARALERLDLPTDLALAIPSYDKLAAIEAIEQHHTQEMFETSQHANRYAAEVRRKFLEALTDLDNEINESNPFDALQTELNLRLAQ